MASAGGGLWEGVRNLIRKFNFAGEAQASLQTEMEPTEETAESKETSETEKPRVEQISEQPSLKRLSSDQRNIQRRSTNRSDKRKGIMFQESSEQIKVEDFKSDLDSPMQISTQGKLQSMDSVDVSVSNKQEATKNEQHKKDGDIKFLESADSNKEALPKDTYEQNEEFGLEKLQEELKDVTRLVLQMDSAMREAKEKLMKLGQLLDVKKTEQQRNRNKLLQNKKDKYVIEMLDKETQTVNTAILVEAFDELQNNIIEQPKQNKFDNTQICRLNRQLDNIDLEELNEIKDQVDFAAETHVTELRKRDRNVVYNTATDNRILEKYTNEETVIIPHDITADEKDVMIVGQNEKESLENQHGIQSSSIVNTDLGKDRQANDSDEVVVGKAQLKHVHLETTKTRTDKQTDAHDACALKLSLKETDKEAIQGMAESKKYHRTEDTEIARHNKNQRRPTNENKFEDGISKTTSLERNLDSATHENEQCIHDNVGQLSLDGEKLRPELAEKSDAVNYQFRTNQVNQYLDFSDAITRELDLHNKRTSEYAKGWNVDIRKEVYSAENKLHEINFSTEGKYQDVKTNPNEANNEQRPKDERHMKTESKIMSSDSEKEDKILSVKSCDDVSKAIWGVTKINDDLFLLRDGSLSSEVWLLKAESFEYLWKLRGRPLDMAVDSRNQHLYISRCIEPDNEIMISVHTISESNRPSEIPKHDWRDYFGRYVTLSITAESNVLLTLMESRKLIEYTYNGDIEKVLREIEITDLANPLHAVKQSKHTYVVCHGENRDEKQRVCIVNASGHLLKDFCLRTNSGMNMSVVPMYLTLGKEGSIIVAENRNGRVVQFNADLTADSVLLTMSDGLRGPCRMYFDEPNGQIIVADNEHGWRDGRLLIRDV